jgi:hypothetical protein
MFSHDLSPEAGREEAPTLTPSHLGQAQVTRVAVEDRSAELGPGGPGFREGVQSTRYSAADSAPPEPLAVTEETRDLMTNAQPPPSP